MVDAVDSIHGTRRSTMALLEDMFKGNLATGLAIGLGTMVLAPTVMPAIGRVLRPAAKAAIKGGMIVYRETVADIKELTSESFERPHGQIQAAHKKNHSIVQRRSITGI